MKPSISRKETDQETKRWGEQCFIMKSFPLFLFAPTLGQIGENILYFRYCLGKIRASEMLDPILFQQGPAPEQFQWGQQFWLGHKKTPAMVT